MAKGSFLTDQEIEEATREFQVPKSSLSGIEGSEIPRVGMDMASWLSDKLLHKMQEIKGWEDSGPIALGSWARNELCPGSDIDLLFSGDQEAGVQVARQCQSLNFKLRYRFPLNPKDWTEGVEAFDVLALQGARAFHWEAGEKLAEQQHLIQNKELKFRSQILSAVKLERQSRGERYNSISNFLEPNIKYGAGGLRDLQQALHINALFAERFFDAHFAVSVFEQYKEFYLGIRQKLHLLGGTEVLTAHHQHEISDWMHFADPLEFMKALQIGLSKVSFYADWVIARASEPKKAIETVAALSVKSFGEAFQALADEPSVLAQARVRAQVETFCKGLTRKQVGRVLLKGMRMSLPEQSFDALFRSRLLEVSLPQLSRVAGHSQHDHYHRFSLDEHIRQSVKGLKRVHDNPSVLGRLSTLAESMSEADWRILLWTCVYHDLGKGLGGDHSTKGAKIVKKEFTQMGFPLRLTVEVAWLVKHHLVLSTAAFRMNPESPKTWKRLLEAGVKGKRLLRLALFTAIDIQSTNPEAWTDWKEQLIHQLVEGFTQPKAEKFKRLVIMAESKKVKVSQKFLEELDPMLFEGVPTATLLQDYQDLKTAKADLPLLILRNKSGQTWIRFHRRKDEPGLFLEFAKLISSLGCQVRQSSIKTLKGDGVYDWFQVKTSKTPAQLRKMASVIGDSVAKKKLTQAKFHSIQVTGDDEEGITVSLRGKDQKGLLLSAAAAFHALNLQIAWARVHTWGKQIDDVFCLKTELSSNELIQELEEVLLDQDQQLLLGESDSAEEIFEN